MERKYCAKQAAINLIKVPFFVSFNYFYFIHYSRIIPWMRQHFVSSAVLHATALRVTCNAPPPPHTHTHTHPTPPPPISCWSRSFEMEFKCGWCHIAILSFFLQNQLELTPGNSKLTLTRTKLDLPLGTGYATYIYCNFTLDISSLICQSVMRQNILHNIEFVFNQIENKMDFHVFFKRSNCRWCQVLKFLDVLLHKTCQFFL